MSIKRVGKGMRLGAILCGLVLGGLCLVGCQSQAPKQQSAKVPANRTITSTASAAPAEVPVTAPDSKQSAFLAAISSAGPEPEVLRVGDSLTITFMDTPTTIPSTEEKIKEDGTITLILNQTFKADGKTRGELEKEIRARYVPDYFKYLTVTVKRDVNTQWYYINGEVKSPARQIYTSRITVLKTIASAGGFTDFANKKKVRLTRLDGRTMTVNCVKALENPALDLEVYPGDTVHVPRRLW
jgi:protein involved in polysaccharide export with SLBB domain